MLNKLYEDFHKNTTEQKKLIKENNFTFRIILKVVNDYLKANSNVLDIGCGAGTIAFYLANRGHKVTGIDISKTAIQVCKQSAKVLKLNKTAFFEVMNFPYDTPKEKYDVIICSEIIEHIKEDRLAFKKMYSLLKSDGLIILSTPSNNAPLYKVGLLKGFDKRVGHERRYNMNELISKAQATGFKIVQTYKTEGVLRNLLFTNRLFGECIKVINKFNLSDIVTFLDNISLKLFGESQLFVILRK